MSLDGGIDKVLVKISGDCEGRVEFGQEEDFFQFRLQKSTIKIT